MSKDAVDDTSCSSRTSTFVMRVTLDPKAIQETLHAEWVSDFYCAAVHTPFWKPQFWPDAYSTTG